MDGGDASGPVKKGTPIHPPASEGEERRTDAWYSLLAGALGGRMTYDLWDVEHGTRESEDGLDWS